MLRARFHAKTLSPVGTRSFELSLARGRRPSESSGPCGCVAHAASAESSTVGDLGIMRDSGVPSGFWVVRALGEVQERDRFRTSYV